ncbi:MAG: NAD(P)/FAD-dependent oxidoreductase [Candidatus Omnitrophica bacterium]|nr:NAD(P)/FAD-dependent oxidoreductase [Candidatus Omnitrophota bacterium]
MKKILVLGSGFAGVNAVKALCRNKDLEITIIDERNYHLFQPLLYQVAIAALSSPDIAVPIRCIFSKYRNVRVLKEKARSVDLKNKKVTTDYGEISYDYLIMACGAKHSYFGHTEWEEYAPGLKTLEQAVEIRDRVLEGFEAAERECNDKCVNKMLTFVIVGGGPTGVELSGAISEMGRFILNRDFRNLGAKKMRVVLIEAGDRILPPFSEKMSKRAQKDLESLGVEVRTQSRVTNIDKSGVEIGNEKIEAKTVLWAAGVEASAINKTLGMDLDRAGRVTVGPDLSIKGYPEVFVLGDQANCPDKDGKPLPGVASVALQQGTFAGKNILRELKGLPRKNFKYFDKGKATTIGKSKAIVEIGPLKFGGFFAWIIWLIVHIWFLTGFENRVVVLLRWAWVYIWHHHGARIIISRNWRFYPEQGG